MAASLNSLSLSLTPQTPSLVAASSRLAPSSLKLVPLPKLVLSLSSIATHSHPPSKLVPHVALSSDLAQEVEEGEEEQRDFAPELKLFVGNLPFNVDSSRLAELFQQAGNVEMVEVYPKFVIPLLFPVP